MDIIEEEFKIGIIIFNKRSPSSDSKSISKGRIAF